ncbi:Putative hemolysin [Malonomonas rubra DSM 5091]|uniref:Putative hemolysin n=1 Tax=Malonomonas rubra DSM 5091 TaxID=1122189 RepID=A0A1M6H5S2_MALRU|nr:GNAT family N-acyltransferase [Malonomonas rubra]SHJ17524.1 Putative hemolysin [Malonomonas rubra DSM 5091]
MNVISEIPANPFLLRSAKPEKQQLKQHALKIIEQLLGLRRCQQLYDQLGPDLAADRFPAAALEKLEVGYRLEEHAAARIPQTGPCILIANHPYGGIEGLILIDLLSKRRPDFKVMANFMLSRIPQLRERLINVDPFGGEDAAKTNLAPLRQSLNHLKQGGLLVIFPAGEVSSYQAEQKLVCDPTWSSTLPRLVRLSKAPVLPVFFPGENGPLFQLAGRIHPCLRTALLPRMLLNKAGQELEVRIGNLLQSKKLKRFNDDNEMNSYLRLRTYALELSPSQTETAAGATATCKQQQIIAALDSQLLETEIAALPQEQHLLRSGEFDIFTFSATQAPALLQEIGRLREVTFRQVGEGTGQSVDLDRFDQDYTHLCMWNREKRELVGSYRLGRVDELIEKNGVDGLYTSTLFDFKPQLLDRLQNSLELGRSFIRTEYQRSYSSLLLLWKGIGHYLVANPQYRYLFGPVSISGDYSSTSRQLMTSALARNFLINDLAALVQPRLPVPLKPLQINGVPVGQADPLLQDMEEVSALVADLETDNKGIPVLLRHYLGLGGKLLAFNLDPDFSDVIDGLLLVDLTQTERKQLQRYMSREGYQSYINHHQPESAHCA